MMMMFDRVKSLEETLREMRGRVEVLQREKEEAYRKVDDLQMQFILWKTQQVIIREGGSE